MVAQEEADHPEYWTPRGIGSDWNLTCLVTGVSASLMPNVSGFVRSKEAGERVVALFGGRARLDYREREPHWIQVKVGVLEEHRAVLDRLSQAVMCCEGVLQPRLIKWALDPVGCPGYEPRALRWQREAADTARLLSEALAS